MGDLSRTYKYRPMRTGVVVTGASGPPRSTVAGGDMGVGGKSGSTGPTGARGPLLLPFPLPRPPGGGGVLEGGAPPAGGAAPGVLLLLLLLGLVLPPGLPLPVEPVCHCGVRKSMPSCRLSSWLEEGTRPHRP